MASTEFHFTNTNGRQVVTINGESVNAVWREFVSRFPMASVLYVRDMTPQIPMVVLG